jgi:GNAT superfamily N-acetyltransferase
VVAMVGAVSEIKIRSAAFDEPAVRELLVEVLDELAQRYGGSGDDTPVAATEFTPPHGAFFVASLTESDAAAANPTGDRTDPVGPAERLVGCAGWRRHGADAELKRMFTTKAARGRGLGRRLLATVEESARAAGCARLILETGDRQPEAVALYESAGYQRIEDFGFYRGHEGVLSYAKEL